MEVFQGHDGSQVVILQDKPFNALIEEYRLTLDKEPWYLDDAAQDIYRTTGLGYYPNGVTINRTIYVRARYKGDWELIAHEYGHILGHEHTHVLEPTLMNPIHQMRLSDPHNLKELAEQNYPELFRKYVLPSEASRNMVIAGMIAVLALAWY